MQVANTELLMLYGGKMAGAGESEERLLCVWQTAGVKLVDRRTRHVLFELLGERAFICVLGGGLTCTYVSCG